MAPALDLDALIDVLHGRAPMLERLASGPASKSELADATAVSRSTVDRGLSELTDWGMVERVGGEYRLTTYGELVFGTYRSMRSSLGALLEARPLVEAWHGGNELSPVVFEGAEVSATRALGPALVDELLRSPWTIRLAFPPLSFVYGTLARQTQEEFLRGKTVDLLLDEEVYDHLERYYDRELDALVERNTVQIFTTPERRPYCLGVLGSGERRRVVVLFDREDDVVGVLTNDGAAAVEWVRERFDRERSAATLARASAASAAESTDPE